MVIGFLRCLHQTRREKSREAETVCRSKGHWPGPRGAARLISLPGFANAVSCRTPLRTATCPRAMKGSTTEVPCAGTRVITLMYNGALHSPADSLYSPNTVPLGVIAVSQERSPTPAVQQAVKGQEREDFDL